MGRKSGQFMSRNGDVYEVVLDGARVLDGSLTLGVPPVVVSMPSGEHKHCGFKTTQCVVNILTDVPMVDLYAQKATDVRLTVNNVTHAGVVFDGYVLPFVFDQSYTGKADMFSVNAVDVLTARKGVKYQNETGWSAPQPWGTDRTAHEIVTGIAARAGIYRVVEHLNFNGTTDKMQDDSPLNVKVAQAGFLQDGVSELDALSAICKFFGYTACLRGDTLWLYDEYCLLNAADGKRTNCNVYVMGRLEQHFYDDPLTMMYDTVVGDVVRNDISVTIERAYDGVQITADGSDVSMLLPNVCASEYITDAPASLGKDVRDDYQQVGDTDEMYYVKRMPVDSALLDLGKGGSGGVTAWPHLSNGDYMRPNDGVNATAGHWNSGSMMVQHYLANIRDVEGDGTTFPKVTQSERKTYLWVRSVKGGNTILAQRGTKAYSHTGGLAKINLSVRIVYNAGYLIPDNAVLNNWEASAFLLRWAQVKVGDKYLAENYEDGSPKWQSESPQIGALAVDKAGELVSSTVSAVYMKTGCVIKIPNDGQVLFVGISNSGDSIYDYYIDSLSIEGVGDDLNLQHPDMWHQFGEADSEFVKVSTMLTSRKSGADDKIETPYGVNARPGVVTSEKWNGGYMGRASSEEIPMSGVLMEQLKARYREPRVCYKMTVSGRVRPYAAVYWAGTGHTVEAYDWDIYEDKTTVTID